MNAQQLKLVRIGMWLGGLLMTALYLLLVAGLGGSDYDQAVADHEWTCKMISEGVWPKDPRVSCPEPVQVLASN